MEGSSSNSSKVQRLIQIFKYRMKPLPDWISNGAIVSLGGGKEEVLSKLTLLQQFNTPIAALWLQDWVGTRNQTIYGIIEQVLKFSFLNSNRLMSYLKRLIVNDLLNST